MVVYKQYNSKGSRRHSNQFTFHIYVSHILIALEISVILH